MNEENVLYTYNEILFSHEKKGNPVICDSLDEPWEYDATWKKPIIE